MRYSESIRARNELYFSIELWYSPIQHEPTPHASHGERRVTTRVDQPALPARRDEHPRLRRALLFAACVVAANALVGERGLLGTIQARREFNRAVAELSRLQYENATLRGEVQKLQRDAKTIEGVARSQLGLIKPGEILVVVKNPPAR
jgi:cell division protein FtsB